MTSRFRNLFRTGAERDHREVDVSGELSLSDRVEIKLADFSPTPSGRNDEDGEYNATRFREEHLIPALRNNGFAVLDLDGVAVCAASFLEEAFVPLVTRHEFTPQHLATHLTIRPDSGHLHDDTAELVRRYISDAASHATST